VFKSNDINSFGVSSHGGHSIISIGNWALQHPPILKLDKKKGIVILVANAKKELLRVEGDSTPRVFDNDEMQTKPNYQ
jgi:hypothetical protein